MFYLLSKSIDILLSPLAWCLLLVALSFVVTRKRVARGLAGAGVVVLVFFSLPVVADALWRWVEPDRAPALRDAPYDAVVLLGGVVSHEPTATFGVTCMNDAAERLTATFELLRSNKARDAIITGGTVSDDDPVVEAEALGQKLTSWGIPEERIVLETKARNTRENATEVARIARERGYASLLLVTSAFHMDRSLAAFKKAGLDPVPYPVDFRSHEPGRAHSRWLPRAEYLANSEKALREMFGRLIYRVVGYA